jgi:serine/threonine protein kinase
VAIKALSKKKIGAKGIKELKNEIKILANLDHPNIVNYYETFENDNSFFIVTEYCPGGDLFDLITQHKE